ncbi:MAG TPA: hypothetical protein VFI25_07875 [Planctomycetota bacterium]|jgi:hypothetical protein|nr:hypothetical protein [Planctomycetota bacterium]
MRTSRIFLPAAALAGAWLLSFPTASTGFVIAGFNLNTNVRDFRVFNSWPLNANTNNTQDLANFPGAVGPVLACWKAGSEWASWPHGLSGLGDPTQPPFPDSLGSGDANFDFVWAGQANTSGGFLDRIISHSPVSLGAGVLAITTGAGGNPPPGATGWQSQFSPDFLWYDGVGNMPALDPRFDIQGVATIQLGLALGLGLPAAGVPPTVPTQTMFGTLAPGPPSVARRSIEADDKAGLQTIYGIKSPTKPKILGLAPASISAQQPLVIFGQNFGATGNEVWFNPGGVQATPPPPTNTVGAALVKVTGLASTGGGTQIVVVPPCNVVDGDLFVKVGALTTGDTLSNGFPIHFSSGGNGAPCLQCIGSIAPASVPVLSLPMTEVVVAAPAGAAQMTCLPGSPACVSPSQYSTVVSVDVGGVTLGPGQFVVDNDSQLRFPLPLFSTLGGKTVTISTSGGPSCASTFTVDAVATPELDTGPPLQLPGQTFTARIAGPLGFNHILVFSTSNVPSVISGVISLGLGNNFADVHSVPTPAPNAAGISEISATIPSNASGVTVFFQGVLYNASNPLGSLPLPATPVRPVSVG